MTVLNRIAHFRGRRDEVPNQELARALAAKRDKKGIREIADNLRNENQQVQSDCLKVLYEVGFIDPALIAGYVGDFIELSRAKNNRLVWGSMIALSTIAGLKAEEIYARRREIQEVIESGSVITIDNGIKALAIVALQQDAYRKTLFPYLLKHLANCRPKDVPQHSEKILVAVTAKNQAEFVQVLEKRMKDMTASQAARVKRVVKEAGKR